MNQLFLFDKSGFPHADTYHGVFRDKRNHSLFNLEGMKLEVDTPEKQEGLCVALNALIRLRLDQASPWKYADCDSDPTKYEIRGKMILLTFRPEGGEDDGMVLISRQANCYAISLPDSDIWNTCGLTWIYRRKCCWHEQINQAPWFGKACTCPPAGPKPKSALL